MQARFLIPMAISLAFGVVFATFITLILVPCGYLILEDARTALGRWWRQVGRGGEADGETARAGAAGAEDDRAASLSAASSNETLEAVTRPTDAHG